MTSTAPELVTGAEIARVARLIRPHVRETPALLADRADFGLAPGPVAFKLEFLQHAGSFKARGAFANLLLREVPKAGIVAASGGNHGAAAAYAARALGVPAHVFVPTVSSPAKIARIRGYGADLVVEGDNYNDALAASERFRATSGALRLHAFDEIETMLGTGTIAVEVARQVPGRTTLLAAVGGGGLLGGLVAGHDGPVIGVEPTGAPTLRHALDAGEPVDAPVGSVALDSLAPLRIGVNTFPVIAAGVQDVLLVEDDAIRAAQRALWETLRVVVEPGGATAFSALLSGRYVPAPDEIPVFVLSGANTTAVEI
ncbi:serine/threonine dehydratase [Asanoa siamensis]|uniref:Threonine dehydratase n=1 Tax=Asanoa siamensis TaxID=926357 RepID=A0ABQ4CL47_9ACTN|nr:serine/threonine dehydratase [Asanoa siamensis]GIF72006.1 threonine dehydratase [Asanoa siamensis]